jgi:hypothetical protein
MLLLLFDASNSFHRQDSECLKFMFQEEILIYLYMLYVCSVTGL